MKTWEQFIDNAYEQIPNKRIRLLRHGMNANQVQISNSLFYNYQSNDYLGLSNHSLIKSVAIDVLRKYGIGSTGAPSLGGYTDLHDKLRVELANWLGFDDAVLFSSGYQMNISIFSQLVNEQVYVWLDRNSHASHIDGVLLSRAKFTRFNSGNINQIREKIMSNDLLHLIITEGIYSMDGLNNDLPLLFMVKKEFPERVLLVVDDAHGIGCIGNNGYGVVEYLGLDFKYCDILLGTFGKAFGSHGGFLCANYQIAQYLQSSVRSQIFSTNLPPVMISASHKALDIIKSPDSAILREHLQHNIQYFKNELVNYGYQTYINKDNNSPIQLIPFDDIERVTKVYQGLYEKNILVGKILYPTVPLQSPRIRISLNVYHSQQDIRFLITSIYNILNK